LVFEDVFEAATGDYITTNVSFEGPHLGAEGVDICGPSVAYLLDPSATRRAERRGRLQPPSPLDADGF
jgi:hypothetical protein